MREWQDPLDEMLDGALASYGEAPEREGLERQVLAKVNQRAQRRRRSIGRFAASLGAAAAAVGCLLWWAMPDIATHPSPTITAAHSAVVPPPANKPPVIKLRRTPKRPAAPKLSQFPAPTPMSSEERALLRLATGDPKYIPRELTRAGTDIAPLRIAAIEIKPLE